MSHNQKLHVKHHAIKSSNSYFQKIYTLCYTLLQHSPTHTHTQRFTLINAVPTHSRVIAKYRYQNTF